MNKNKAMFISEMLKNWYFIDSVLLNEHAKKCITDSKQFNEYVSLKAALLSDLNEFYKYIDYSPKGVKIPEDHKVLQEQAVQMAKKSKSVAATMLECKDMKNHLKKMIMTEFSKTKKDVNAISDRIINERFIKMSLDNMLIGIPVLECKNKEKVSDFKGGMLEQAYLTVRSEMLKIAREYNPILKKNLVNEALADVGFINFAGFSIASPKAKAIEVFENSCSKKCSNYPINTSARKGCILKCKVQVQQKIIASLRQSAAQSNNVEARMKFAKDVKRAQMKMAQYQIKLAKLMATRSGAEAAGGFA
jgi:hypothetical protein